MTEERIVTVHAVLPDCGVVVIDEGRSVPIVRYMDCFGRDCDLEDAVVAVAGNEECGYFVVDDLFEILEVTIH